MSEKRFGCLGKAFLIFSVCFLLLFITNPSEQDFKDYLKNEIRMQAHNTDPVSGFILRAFSSPAVALATLNMERYNFQAFSIYVIYIFDEEYIYIGVLGNFILIS